MMQATEQQAEDAYNRLTPMHKNGDLSDVKYVEVETGLQKAKAAAAIAKKIWTTAICAQPLMGLSVNDQSTLE